MFKSLTVCLEFFDAILENGTGLRTDVECKTQRCVGKVIDSLRLAELRGIYTLTTAASRVSECSLTPSAVTKALCSTTDPFEVEEVWRCMH